MTPDRRPLMIGEVAARFDVAVSTLRYYDELGLLTPAERRGAARCYGQAQLQRLALVQLLQGGQLSLQEIADVIAGPDDGRAWHKVLGQRIDALEHQVRRAQEAKAVLEHLHKCPHEDPVADCNGLARQLRDEVDTRLAGDYRQTAAVPGS